MVPEIDRDADYWLGQWARWCRIDDTKLGYPSKSPGFSCGGESQRWDDFSEGEAANEWRRCCEAMDACIRGLEQAEQIAIRQLYLGERAVFRFLRLEALLNRATDKLLIGMRKRNVL